MAGPSQGARDGGSELQRASLARHRGGARASEDVRVAHQTDADGAAKRHRRAERRGGRARARLQGRIPRRIHPRSHRRAREKGVARRTPGRRVLQQARGAGRRVLRVNSRATIRAIGATRSAAGPATGFPIRVRDGRGSGRRVTQAAPGAQAAADAARPGVRRHERADGKG